MLPVAFSYKSIVVTFTRYTTSATKRRDRNNPTRYSFGRASRSFEFHATKEQWESSAWLLIVLLLLPLLLYLLLFQVGERNGDLLT